MGIRLCLGNYAKEAYEPEYMGIRVYSLEELCYFIKDNAYLLDESFIKEDLGIWISRECGMKELGEDLQKAARKKISMKSFVGILMDYACFFPKNEVEEIFLAITENSKKSIFEKKKAKADAMAERGQYGIAIEEYRRLLNMIPEDQIILQGETYHGLGVCLARLFYFTEAGEMFQKAHQLTGRFTSYRQYLWTKRLSLPEEEYLSYLHGHEEALEESLAMENFLDKLKREWNDSVRGRWVAEIHIMKDEHRISEYESLLREKADYLKVDYRHMAEN